MRALDPALSLAALRRRVSGAAAPLLLLDYDGTLAPFTPRRDEAVPYPGVRAALRAIRRGGRTKMVVISGRPVAEVTRLLAVRVDEVWGGHGHEHRHDGRREISPEARAGARGLSAACDALAEHGWAAQLELKIGSLAVHWRGLPPARVRSLRSLLRRAAPGLAAAAGAALRPFDGGLELRLPGRDKGWVVRRVLSSQPRRRPVAFLGDDLTDEDGFRALRRGGVAVLVRPRPRPTAARLWLRPPNELLEFLTWWT